MISIDLARTRSRSMKEKNETIRKQEEAIDNAIRSASSNGDFYTILRLPDLMDVVIDEYKSAGYTIVPKTSTTSWPFTTSGYYIYWGEEGDSLPILL